MSGAGSADQEQIDILDDQGEFAFVTTRRDMRDRNLWHRTVFVVVTNLAGDVLVHRRADWKDVWPGLWDFAFGGVISSGEAWEAAAIRELAEEAGISAELTYLGEGIYEDEDVRERARIYRAHHEGPFGFPDGEVVEVAWVSLHDLQEWTANHEICPDSKALVMPRLDAP